MGKTVDGEGLEGDSLGRSLILAMLSLGCLLAIQVDLLNGESPRLDIRI
jgi:hypothetical protein